MTLIPCYNQLDQYELVEIMLGLTPESAKLFKIKETITLRESILRFVPYLEELLKQKGVYYSPDKKSHIDKLVEFYSLEG